MHIQQHFHIM
ncbi:hypothetical protein MXB_1096 [Myxobolus squamalis]|nr:hypothetical protein MXB_1096 [Myxobolus squamalis]